MHIFTTAHMLIKVSFICMAGSPLNVIKNEKDNNFLSLVIYIDDVQISKDSSSSLWILTFAINEIKRSERFKLKNIITGGIVSSALKPTRAQLPIILASIIEELLILEQGKAFEIKGSDDNSFVYLKAFLIAYCSDKPAQSLVQGISELIGAFACGRYEIEGKIYLLN